MTIDGTRTAEQRSASSGQPIKGGTAVGSEPSDAALLKQIAAGDRTAAGVFVKRHQVMVRSFLLRLCGRPDVADDLAQETFIRVLRYADRYDPKYAIHTWLLTIARRLWINQIRHDKRRQAGPVIVEPVSTEADPLALASKAERREVTRETLDTAIQRLSEPQRTAIALFHQQELSMAEAAEIMGMPIGTVKSHLHRGRAVLRRILAPKLEQLQP
jgi:RNA polymerase sigma-70 factor (ECF subfamily)